MQDFEEGQFSAIRQPRRWLDVYWVAATLGDGGLA